ncbi:hypothetical protein FSPOR_6463 [Fusarium sporotrichioides]|uniref:Extracellular membrane protein CFEM domain-containing protein n=1 Tax=Fusarium sporotrichioides TaxID=5514 RepID=A0A395S2U7_FUSSP|nr:hypothetical protein FSPOR_6463 [Fusarium sporotrichioides]
MGSKWAILILPLLSYGVEITPRHDGHDHDHSSHHNESGTGHGHNMAHGQFNFTPSGIPWPTCARTCCNANFDNFPEPVNHPLCISQPFYDNVTACVASNCTEYEQGAYAVVAEIECPKDEDYEVDIDKEAVVTDLKDAGGSPQSCEGVNNETIQCQNGTSENAGIKIGGEVGLVFSAATIAGLAALLAFSL